MNAYSWYKKLKKPSWAPPSWLFGPVWTVLYIIIAISFGSVFYKAVLREISWIVTIPFFLNLAFNVIFTPIQFGLKNNYLAALDILCVLFTLIWLTIIIHPFAAWISYAQIPYVLWVSFATVLQLTVTYINRKNK
jgi:translocator protein